MVRRSKIISLVNLNMIYGIKCKNRKIFTWGLRVKKVKKMLFAIAHPMLHTILNQNSWGTLHRSQIFKQN